MLLEHTEGTSQFYVSVVGRLVKVTCKLITAGQGKGVPGIEGRSAYKELDVRKNICGAVSSPVGQHARANGPRGVSSKR